MSRLSADGFEIHRGVIPECEIEQLRIEADRVAAETGQTSVRHLRSRSELFDSLSTSAKLLELLPNDLSPVRSILFNKTKASNWPVAWHQDLTIAVNAEIPCEGYELWTEKEGIPHVQPPLSLLKNMVTARVHLDLADSDNGALLILPKSHKLGKIPPAQIAACNSTEPVTCECNPGDVLLMSPLILHSSRRATNPSSRRVLHFEYAKLDSIDPRLTWHEANLS